MYSVAQKAIDQLVLTRSEWATCVETKSCADGRATEKCVLELVWDLGLAGVESQEEGQ